MGAIPVAGGLVDFRFSPTTECDGKVAYSTLESIVRYLNDPNWYSGLTNVLVWMMISDNVNIVGAMYFMSCLSDRHLDMFVIAPSFYVPCISKSMLKTSQMQKWKDQPALMSGSLSTRK